MKYSYKKNERKKGVNSKFVHYMVILSEEQQRAFDLYRKGENVFITGPGGVGKSALIRQIYQDAIRVQKDIYVTALTGCAAILLNCKAKTLHSWAGIGLGKGSVEDLIHRIKNNHFLRAIWKDTEVLVVDEVSMLSLKLFDTLNLIGKVIRKNTRPFGGIQLVFSGDFYQLPPVGDRDEPDTQRFCFESDDWNSVFHRRNQIELVKIFRQTDDVYASILNQIREGRIRRKSNDLLMTYVGRERDASLLIEPTKLYPTKNKVEQINSQRMSSLNTEERKFVIKYLTDVTMTKSQTTERNKYSMKEITTELDYLAGNLPCEKELVLKAGCQVMSVVNIKDAQNDILICNGSQGVVVGFSEDSLALPVVKFHNGVQMTMVRHVWESEKIPGIGVSQVPLILSWALTIHKSQGATLDVAEIDVGNSVFECGQTYVALSRVKSLDGLYLTSFDARRIRIHKKVKEFYEALRLYHATDGHLEAEYCSVKVGDPEDEIGDKSDTAGETTTESITESTTESTTEKKETTTMEQTKKIVYFH